MGFLTNKSTYTGYVVLMLSVTIAPMLLREVTIDYQLFDFDLSEPDMLRKVAYHLGLMLQPTILAWIILTHASGYWRVLCTISFLFFVKECVDVIVYNNSVGTFWYELAGYLLIITITSLLWAQRKGITNNS